MQGTRLASQYRYPRGMSVQREQSHIAGTFNTEQEALAAKAVKTALDKINTWIVYEIEDGKWVLARVIPS